MATYPLIHQPNISYSDHLLINDYVSDVTTGIERSASTIVESTMQSAEYLSETYDMNLDFLAEIVAQSTVVLHEDLKQLNSSVSVGFDDVKHGIAGLQSRFDIGMGKALAQFELMRNEMKESFNEVTKLLENKRKTKADEHFRDAIDYYNDGCRFPDKPKWMENALRHLLASVEEFDRNPLAHFLIGHIYHYQENLQNFDQAIVHYENAYTYGEANQKDFSVAAQACFYAGWLRAAEFNDFDDAIRLTNESLRFDNNIPESHYHLAKFYSLKKDNQKAIEHLEIAITKFDKKYCFKAAQDPDFNSLQKEVKELFLKLRNGARDKFAQVVNPYFDEIKDSLDDTYFSYLELLKTPKKQRYRTFAATLRSIDKARSRLESIGQESSILTAAKVIVMEIDSKRKKVLENFKKSLKTDAEISVSTKSAKKQADRFEKRFVESRLQINKLLQQIEKIKIVSLKENLLSKMHDTDVFSIGLAFTAYAPGASEGIEQERKDIKTILELYAQAEKELNDARTLIRNNDPSFETKSKVEKYLQEACNKLESWQDYDYPQKAFEEAISLIRAARECLHVEHTENRAREHAVKERRKKTAQQTNALRDFLVQAKVILPRSVIFIIGTASGAVIGSIIISLFYFVLCMIAVFILAIPAALLGVMGEIGDWLENLMAPVGVVGLVLGAISAIGISLNSHDKLLINIIMVVIASVLFALCWHFKVGFLLPGISVVMELLGFNLY